MVGRWVDLLVAVSIEFCMVFWAASAFIAWDRASASQGAALASLFLVGMAGARLSSARIIRRVPNPRNVVLLCTAGATAGFVLFWAAPNLALAAAGLLAAGLGVGLLYPTTVSRVVAAWPHAPDRAAARAALASGLAIGGAPFLLAQISDAAGLRTYKVGLGDASLYPTLLEAVGVAPEAHDTILSELAAGDFVGVEREVRRLGLGSQDVDLLLRVPQTRGGPEVLEGLSAPLDAAVSGMRGVHQLLAPEVAERIIFDLGLVRSLGYYTGAVFQVYDPAHGVPIGSGGRYDELLASFGRPLPAVGFAIGVERLHIALTGEERGLGGTR